LMVNGDGGVAIDVCKRWVAHTIDCPFRSNVITLYQSGQPLSSSCFFVFSGQTMYN
jgi:hypothetical protein